MKVKKIPMRRCVGCMESKPKMQMIRIVAQPEGSVKIDPSGKANGRGIYLCPNEECFSLARKKRAIGRGLQVEISEENLNKLFEELSDYARKNS
jgi:predicted RNA-binding protein YlxR (DUF448 family)